MSNNEMRLEQLQNWKKSLELKKILDNQGINTSNQDYLAQLTYKIAERAFGNSSKNNLENKVCEMVEQQTCAICFELMVPPKYSPILLFPCGHSFCKNCVLDGQKLRIQKCSLCRAKITAHAINLGLQNLICTFAEQKLQAPAQPQYKIPDEIEKLPQNNPYANQYKMYKMRCDILESEKSQLQTQLKDLQQDLKNLEKKLGYFQTEREKVIEQQTFLQAQLESINEGLQTIVDQSQGITVKMHNIQEQMKILDETMKPLQLEMKKYEVLAKST